MAACPLFRQSLPEKTVVAIRLPDKVRVPATPLYLPRKQVCRIRLSTLHILKETKSASF